MGDHDINITVKFRGRSIPITISPDSTVVRLKSILLLRTNVLVRGQKLIFKGKVLVNEMTLKEAKVTNGAKIMLVGSQGLHLGEGPHFKEAQTQFISRNSTVVEDKKEVPVDKNSLERWKATGVMALAECNLKIIPDEIWACSPFIRILDISNNSIQRIPEQIDCFTGLEKLFLNANGLSNESISWGSVAMLRNLTVLSISQNCLNALPCTLGNLSVLKQLDVSNNKLTTLPNEIGSLSKLEILKANNNSISFLPENIGDCTSLIEIDLSSNLLSELPAAFESLRNLKTFSLEDEQILYIMRLDFPSIEMFFRVAEILQALRLSNNALESLPTSLFSMCVQLSTLDLHKTKITMDILRQIEGWDGFDERRRSKHQKQLDFGVMGSTEFDEGADKS